MGNKHRLIQALLALSFTCTASANQVLKNNVAEAVISNECAPWDGAAFRTVALVGLNTANSGVVVANVYKSSKLPFGYRLEFSDKSSKNGRAMFYPGANLQTIKNRQTKFKDVSGSIFWESVKFNEPVKGFILLKTKDGIEIKEKFIASWDTRERVMCG